MTSGTPRPAVRPGGAPLSLGGTTGVAALTAKILFLGAVAAIALTVGPALLATGNHTMLIGLVVAVVAIFLIYTTQHAVPAKYLFPGTFFLTLFIVVPIVFTLQISMTNYGDGTRGSHDETVAKIVASSVVQTPDSPTYALTLATGGTPESGPYAMLLRDPGTDELLVGTADGVEPLDPATTTVTDGRITSAEGWTVLSARAANAAGAEVTELTAPLDDEHAIRASGLTTAFAGRATLAYDEDAGTLRSTVTGEVFTIAVQGDREYYVDATGARVSDQSWRASVGLSNYTALVTDPAIRDSLIQTFVWTLFFAVFSVVGTFVVGLFIATALNDVRIRGSKLYRSLMIIPYATPTFIGFLVWSTFYNKDFGLFNQVLGTSIDWLGDPTAAKVAICLANLWAGIPYMFLISTGALQSVPEDVVEAAALDGAGPVRAFASIKFPLLLISVAPLLVSSFAYNFNNFNAIKLLTGGGPFKGDGAVFGGTDILISGIYRLAFGGEGARFGLAAAVSVLLFVITGVMAAVQFRYTKALEDVQ